VDELRCRLAAQDVSSGSEARAPVTVFGRRGGIALVERNSSDDVGAAREIVARRERQPLSRGFDQGGRLGDDVGCRSESASGPSAERPSRRGVGTVLDRTSERFGPGAARLAIVVCEADDDTERAARPRVAGGGWTPLRGTHDLREAMTSDGGGDSVTRNRSVVDDNHLEIPDDRLRRQRIEAPAESLRTIARRNDDRYPRVFRNGSSQFSGRHPRQRH
jgi:hypothetical protein